MLTESLVKEMIGVCEIKILEERKGGKMRSVAGIINPCNFRSKYLLDPTALCMPKAVYKAGQNWKMRALHLARQGRTWRLKIAPHCHCEEATAIPLVESNLSEKGAGSTHEAPNWDTREILGN